MKQLSTRWYEWSHYASARRLDEHSHFLAGADGAPGTIVDPVPFDEGDLTQLRELGGAAAVLLTGAGRTDEGRRCAEALGCGMMDAAADPEAKLPEGWVAIHLPHGDSTTSGGGEVALFHEETRTAVTGASVTGFPAGALSLADTSESVNNVADLAAHAPSLGAAPVVAARIEGATETSPAAQTARAVRGLLGSFPRTVLVGAGMPVFHEAPRALQDLAYRHDPAAMIVRQEDLRWDPPVGMFTLGTCFGVRFGEYAPLMGIKTLEFDMADVPPGRQSGQLHRHDGEEELFVILTGRGELLTEHATYPLRAGDVVGFPPRYQIAHAFRNTGDEPFRYLAFGAPTEQLDMVDYPETAVRAESTRYGKRYLFILPEERHIPY